MAVCVGGCAHALATSILKSQGEKQKLFTAGRHINLLAPLSLLLPHLRVCLFLPHFNLTQLNTLFPLCPFPSPAMLVLDKGTKFCLIPFVCAASEEKGETEEGEDGHK